MNPARELLRVARMLLSAKAIELVRIPGAILEQEEKFMIRFRGQPWGQLYFNMRGYVAERGIPIPSSSGSGQPAGFSIGEKPLSAYKSAINKANREWEQMKSAKEVISDDKGWYTSKQGWPMDQKEEVEGVAKRMKSIGRDVRVVRDGKWWRIEFKVE